MLTSTLYFNAKLKIKQYLKRVEGFLHKQKGAVYEVCKALYGLTQSGREWNEELNKWFLAHGYKRCKEEPCLHSRAENGIKILVLVYVDDLMVARNSEDAKSALFEELDRDHGIRDLGLLKSNLGIEVNQSGDRIKITQSQYCKKILERYGFIEESNAAKIPMDITCKLIGCTEKSACLHETKFPYRQAIGSLCTGFLYSTRFSPPCPSNLGFGR